MTISGFKRQWRHNLILVVKVEKKRTTQIRVLGTLSNAELINTVPNGKKGKLRLGTN